MSTLADWEFANIQLLWALVILPLLLVWYIIRSKARVAPLQFSGTTYLGKTRGGRSHLLHVPFVLRLAALGILIVALARPQSKSSWQDVTTEGIDIVIAMDISSSMLARDFEPNRLDAAKEVAIQFIQSRPNDRIGLVVYAGEAFTQCPLTTDHDKLINLFEGVKFGSIQDGTAIGMGLATAVNRLKESDSKSKVVILLTDGQNTAGSIPPITAAEIAANYGIKAYTIGVGTKGQAPMPFQDMFGRITYQMMDVNIDEEMLQNIAKLTNGKYFRATDNEKLGAIYAEIDEMEKTIIEETQYEKKYEEYLPLTLAALSLLIAELLMRKFVLRSAVTDV